MPLKEEEFNTIAILSGIAAVFIIPTVILAIFRKGPLEYLTAITIFFILGVIFWNAGAVLRED